MTETSLALVARLLARIAAELRYLDARHVRRHFCFQCDRQTIRQHNHHAENVAAFRRIVGEEWRP